MPTRKYTYYDYTISLCPECLKRIDAKIVFEDKNVYMLKRCPEHGNSKVLIADDIEYYKNIRNYNKPSETPYKCRKLKRLNSINFTNTLFTSLYTTITQSVCE